MAIIKEKFVDTYDSYDYDENEQKNQDEFGFAPNILRVKQEKEEKEAM